MKSLHEQHVPADVLESKATKRQKPRWEKENPFIYFFYSDIEVSNIFLSSSSHVTDKRFASNNKRTHLAPGQTGSLWWNTVVLPTATHENTLCEVFSCLAVPQLIRRVTAGDRWTLLLLFVLCGLKSGCSFSLVNLQSQGTSLWLITFPGWMNRRFTSSIHWQDRGRRRRRRRKVSWNSASPVVSSELTALVTSYFIN